MIVTTLELKAMLERGERVTLPPVRLDSVASEHYSATELAQAHQLGSDNPVVSVEYVGEEEVQCISIADEDHLYLTDDFIPTHNTSNIVFLKSTDDSMIETLEKMSGTRHVARTDSKTFTEDLEAVVKPGNVQGNVSYTMSLKEEPVISYNDMAFISERQSVVFRAGDAPVWNRNETILPMSWRLFRDDIVHPGHDYSLQTIPTLSSAIDFDVRMNQPDFAQMLAKRMSQAVNAVSCVETYKRVYEYEDVDVARLDPDVYSEEVMELVDAIVREQYAAAHGIEDDEVDPEMVQDMAQPPDSEEDREAQATMRLAEQKHAVFTEMRYAGGQISREMLVRRDGYALEHVLEVELVEAYKSARTYLERDRDHFATGSDGSLRSADGSIVYVSRLDESQALGQLHSASQDSSSRVFAEPGAEQVVGAAHQVHGAFLEMLAGLDTWKGLGEGEFDRAMAHAMRSRE